MDLDLTKRQKEIFDFIGKYAAKTGYPPTVREIGKAVGLHSSSTVHAHLANLEKIGLLRRDPSKPRAIELLFDRAKKTILPGRGLPLVGHVAAGEPILAEENVEEYIEIPDVIGGEDGDYILRVRGESMKDAGIFEGDYVVVRPAEEAADGEIVVALIGEEATVKRFYPRSRPRPAAARERDDGADPHHRGTDPRPRRRRLSQSLLAPDGAQGQRPDSISFLLTQRSSEPLREIAAAAAAWQASWSRTSSSIETVPSPIASAVSAAAPASTSVASTTNPCRRARPRSPGQAASCPCHHGRRHRPTDDIRCD